MFDRKANDQYYLSQGKCPSCGGKRPVVPGRKRCEICAKTSREKNKALRAERRNNGLCPQCGNPRTDPKKITCETCLGKNRKNQNLINMMTRRLRTRRIEQGLCARCGKNPFKPGCTMCLDCIEREKIKRKERDPHNMKRKQRYAERVKLGLCVDCGQPTEKYHRCDKCREKRKESWRKRKAATNE